MSDWIAKTLKAGRIVGFDPWLHAPAMIEDLAKELESKRIKLKALGKNPVDRVWGQAAAGTAAAGPWCRIRSSMPASRPRRS